MSTIKSSAENLTLNADGANNDVIIQSNGSTKVTVDGQNSRVGIGVTVPDSNLHVHGTGTLLSSDSYFVAQIQTDRNDNGSSDDAILQFVNGSGKTVKGEIRWDESSNTFELGHGDNQGHLVIASGGDVTVGSGNLVIGTAGKGIDFSATSGSGTSEVLDDYEEGTWTPAPIAGTATVTGTYTKIGNQVTVEGSMTDFSNITSTSTNNIYGLPFTNGATTGTCSINLSYVTLDSGYTSVVGYVYPSNTILRIYQNGSNKVQSIVNQDSFTSTSSTILRFSATYSIA